MSPAAISGGRVVMSERPVAAVPSKRQRKERCWRCFKMLGFAPFYCSGCPNVSEAGRGGGISIRRRDG